MTLQDYVNLVTDSLGNYFTGFGDVATPIVVALIILIIGLVVATILRVVWVEITKFINLEKSIAKLGSYSSLTKSNKALSVTELVGNLIWWSAVIVYVLPALQALEINQVNETLSNVFGYIPTAIVGVLYLALGALVAWFAYLIIFGVSSLIKIPAADGIAKVVAGAIVIFSLLLSLRILGVSQEIVRFMIIGTIAASTLAFGLAGRDLATDILKKVRTLIK